jgi:hypothetical protein
MSTISSRQMRAIARDLMNDAVNGRQNRASRNDGQLLARMVQTGTASRAALDAAIDEIEKSSLPLDHKKEALRVLERYKADSATGFAKELFSVDEGFLQQLGYHGIDSVDKLLASGTTTAKREVLAQQVGSSEKEIRRLCKQADLIRVDGIEGKMAHALLNAGIDSVPELAGRNAANLHKKLEEFAKSQEGYVVSFKAPKLEDVEKWVAEAGTLGRKLEFGSAEDSFGSLNLQERLDLFLDGGDPLKVRDFDAGLVKLFADLGVDDAMPMINAMRANAASAVSDELDVWDISVPASTIEGLTDYDALIEWVTDNIGDVEADALGNGWAEWKNPDIEVLKNGRETVGARITFSRAIDGDHDYYATYIFDAKENRMVAVSNGGYEMDTETEDIGPGEAISGSKTAKLLGDLTATGVEVDAVGRYGLDAWATSHEGGSITKDSVKASLGLRHDNITVRAYSDNDGTLASLTTGLSAADKKKVEDGVAFMKSKLTNLSVIDTQGGYWGDENSVTGVTLAGLDPSGNLVSLRASFSTSDDG